MQAFHYSLKPSGYLLLGKSETIGNSTELFNQGDRELKIYTRKDTPPGNAALDFSLRPSTLVLQREERLNTESLPEIDIEKETDKLLLPRYVPASVLVNKDLQILRFHGATSNYLQPSSGRASLNLLKMLKDELVFELKGLINRAKKETVPVKKENVRLSQNGTEKTIGLEVVPVKSHLKDNYYLILFREDNGHPVVITAKGPDKTKDSKDEHIANLEQQLNEAREYMKTMSEEFEANRKNRKALMKKYCRRMKSCKALMKNLKPAKKSCKAPMKS